METLKRTPFATILSEVATAHGLTVEEITGRTIRKDLGEARFDVVTRARAETYLSLNQIGRLMGGRHHTTILNMLDPIPRETQRTRVPRGTLFTAEDFDVLAVLDPALPDIMRADRRARRNLSQPQLRVLFEAAREQARAGL